MGIDLSLRRAYFDLLAKLGNPHLKLPPAVHVAGTNGKGSVCAFLRAAVEAAGYCAHVYTSPHLVSYNERIRVAGGLIEEDEFVEILLECEKLTEPGEVTCFEALTATAFAVFARHSADITIIETGLGGRLDATNVIPFPSATIITRLSFDHREYLGETMAEIAREKAGIMRAGIKCFTAPQPSAEAMIALQEAAGKTGALLVVGGKDWAVKQLSGEEFAFTGKQRALTLPMPALAGKHQLWNAGLAVSSLEALPLKMSEGALRMAMQTVEWPGRLQKLVSGRFVEKLPSGWELWLDGGHNDSAGEVLAEQMKEWRSQNSGEERPVFVVLGMLSTKRPQEFMKPMLPHIKEWRTVAIPGEPLCFTAEELAKSAQELGIENISPEESPKLAISALSRCKAVKARILVCGSLYLVGHCLRENSRS